MLLSNFLDGAKRSCWEFWSEKENKKAWEVHNSTKAHISLSAIFSLFKLNKLFFYSNSVVIARELLDLCWTRSSMLVCPGYYYQLPSRMAFEKQLGSWYQWWDSHLRALYFLQGYCTYVYTPLAVDYSSIRSYIFFFNLLVFSRVTNYTSSLEHNNCEQTINNEFLLQNLPYYKTLNLGILWLGAFV